MFCLNVQLFIRLKLSLGRRFQSQDHCGIVILSVYQKTNFLLLISSIIKMNGFIAPKVHTLIGVLAGWVQVVV